MNISVTESVVEETVSQISCRTFRGEPPVLSEQNIESELRGCD